VTLTGLIAPAPAAGAATDSTDVPGLELLTSDIDPAKPRADVLRVAVVSDFGGCGYGVPAKCADENAVVDMIHSWNPDFILTGGDNSQQQATEEQVRLSVEPYTADIEAGKFFPIFGNHDFGNTCDAVGAQYSMHYLKVPLSYRAVLGNRPPPSRCPPPRSTTGRTAAPTCVSTPWRTCRWRFRRSRSAAPRPTA
jgi:hypothetical protein